MCSKKLFLIFTVCIFFQLNVYSELWETLEPMDVYSETEYESYLSDNYECNRMRISFLNRRIYISYMDEEPEYSVNKSNADSKRIILAFYEIPETFEEETSVDNNQEVYSQNDEEQFLDAMCIDSIQNDIFENIIKNDYGFAYQGLDKKGKRYLLHTGTRSVEIGCYKLGKLEISKGILEASESSLYCDAPLYFWDKKTKKLICLSPLKKQLVDFGFFLNNPAFVYDAADETTGNINLYIVDYEDDGETPVIDKAWLCKGGEIFPLGE